MTAVVRLWVSFDTHGLTPAQTRAQFLQALHTAIAAAFQQGRIDRAVAEQLRHALQQREQFGERPT